MTCTMDYDGLAKAGSALGAGSVIVMDESTCMVQVLERISYFYFVESCGQCTPCREGTKRMLEILTRISEGEGVEGDVEKLLRLAETIKMTSLCGLGQAAPNPVISTITHFREEYDSHIRDKHCSAGVCSALATYSIDAEKCIGCTACKRVCPVDCITGAPKVAHVIDDKECIKCGSCFDACKFDAVKR